MELVNRQSSDGLIKRRILLGAYVVVAVPVSSLLWELLSPVRQIQEQHAFLPMRDAVASRPLAEGSLTPPMFDVEEVSTRDSRTSLPTPPSARGGGATGGGLMERFGQALSGKKGAPERDGAGAGRGRLSPFSRSNGGGGGGGGGGQSGSAFGSGRVPAPILAGAGPLGSVGLVSSGSSKRFSPAIARRGGNVSGFTSPRSAAGRLANGASSNPQFGSAGAPAGIAGLPGGSPESGAGASLGGPSIGAMGTQTDEDNSSFINPALPLEELSPVGPSQDVSPGGPASTAILAAACDAFTQAVLDSTALQDKLRDKVTASAKRLRNVATGAQNQIETWTKSEQTQIEHIESKIPISCKFEGEEYCGALNACLGEINRDLKDIRGILTKEAVQLSLATQRLTGEPPKRLDGYDSAGNAIDTETELAKRVREHQTLRNKKVGCVTSVPDRVTLGANEVVFNAGRDAKEQYNQLLGEDFTTQRDIQTDGLGSSWCDRAQKSCGPIDVAPLFDELKKHNAALQEWRDMAPAEPLGNTDKAFKLVEEAMPLLSSPGGAYTQNLVNGARKLHEAYDALSDATQQWNEKREVACRGAR